MPVLAATIIINNWLCGEFNDSTFGRVERGNASITEVLLIAING
jgi:hypothetical protein